MFSTHHFGWFGSIVTLGRLHGVGKQVHVVAGENLKEAMVRNAVLQASHFCVCNSSSDVGLNWPR